MSEGPHPLQRLRAESEFCTPHLSRILPAPHVAQKQQQALTASQALKQAHEQLAATHATLASSSSEHSSALAELQAHISSAKAEHQTTLDQLAESQTDKQLAVTQLAAAKAQHDQLVAQFASTKEEHESILGQVSGLREEREHLQTQLDESNGKHGDLVSELEETVQAHESAKTQMDELKASHETALGQMKDSHVLALKELSEGGSSQVTEIQVKLDETIQQLAAKEAELTELRSKLETREKADGAAMEEKQKELNGVRRGFDKIQLELEDALASARKADKAKANLEAEKAKLDEVRTYKHPRAANIGRRTLR